MTFENEIACVDVTSIDPANPHTSQICAVGLWTDIRVVLVRLPTMEILASHGLPGEILPRSLLLSRFEGVPYLLVGLGKTSVRLHIHKEIGAGSTWMKLNISGNLICSLFS